MQICRQATVWQITFVEPIFSAVRQGYTFEFAKGTPNHAKKQFRNFVVLEIPELCLQKRSSGRIVGQ